MENHNQEDSTVFFSQEEMENSILQSDDQHEAASLTQDNDETIPNLPRLDPYTYLNMVEDIRLQPLRRKHANKRLYAIELNGIIVYPGEYISLIFKEKKDIETLKTYFLDELSFIVFSSSFKYPIEVGTLCRMTANQFHIKKDDVHVVAKAEEIVELYDLQSLNEDDDFDEIEEYSVDLYTYNQHKNKDVIQATGYR
ncbi:hypothetical protein RF11_07312 [Thelohanellus kitauei]|uniref:Uncharacterized protein n=1 Tax=Thelohanellus kitauei TaxID=669202 RepID=A0A0C2MU48_THEKT|nr:hypothetical protein RF11_07312 [Thelohanellus kitauei]